MRRVSLFLVLMCACVLSVQAQIEVTYHPWEGKSGAELITNKYGRYSMQAAHEDWNIIYAQPGSTITLRRRNDTFHAYARWYNYNDNTTMDGLTPSETPDYTSANGQIRTRANSSVSGFTATYEYNGGTVRIACDQSAYSDYQLSGTSFREPTISQRIVYEIRPASEMARKVDQATSEFMESYELIAPTGQIIYLGPEYAFNSTGYYPSYFYNESAPVAMNTTAFTGSTSGSTIGDWQETVTNRTNSVVYTCTTAYNEPAGGEVTATWTPTSASALGTPDDLSQTTSGTFTDNQSVTWNFTRTAKNSHWVRTGIIIGGHTEYYWNTNFTSANGIQLGQFDNADYREDVKFTTVGYNDKTIKRIEIVCYSTADKDGNAHEMTVKVGTTSLASATSVARSLHTYTYAPNIAGNIEISFTAKNKSRALYIKSIKVVYETVGRGQSFVVGATSSEEPAAAYAANWKKTTTEVVASDWTKIDTESAGNSAGWNWTVDGVAQSSPNTFSGQFIQASSSSVGTHTYQLMYTSGGGSTTKTTSTKSDETTTVTTYTYNNGWQQHGDPEISTDITRPETSTVETEGGTGGASQIYKIAKFTVKYMDITKVGPYLITDYAYLLGTDKIAGQDFNFDEPGVSTRAYYIHPLSPEESTFGFYYGSGQDRTQTNTYWNEYCFVNNGYGYRDCANMANHVGDSDGVDATKGYALYTDGSQKPGTVFSLNFDAELCAGAKMYFSAWIGDQNAGGNNPSIFDFIVVGVDENKVEHNLTTFTTGEFKGSGWKRILFPLEFNANVDYEQYKLRVVNKAATTTGNDFFIDDIAVYLQKAPITPIQASTPQDVCIDEEADLVLYTRVDYAQVETEGAGEGATRKFYYRWINEAGETITTDKYLNPVEGNTAGTIIVPELESAIEAAGSVYDHSEADFAAFDAAHNKATAPVCRFIKENCTNADGTVSNRYVVYVATPIEVQLGVKYKCVIASSIEALGANNDCSSSATITVSNGMRINSVKMGGMVKTLDKSACANYSYDLSLAIEYAVLEGSKTTSKTCDYLAHWMFGKMPAADATEKELASFKALYGASFDEINDALAAHNEGTENDIQANLIERLVEKGLLVLAETLDQTNPVYNVTPLVTNASVSYTAFPVRRLCDDAPKCNDPKTITLYFESTDPNIQKNVIYFVKEHNESDIPQFVLSRPRRVRVLEGTDVSKVLLDLSDPNNTYRLKSMVLYATDDQGVLKNEINKSQVLTSFKPVDVDGNEQAIVSSATDGVAFAGLAALTTGCSYTFKINYEVLTSEEGKEECVDDKGNKHDGEAFITFMIVPELVHFNAASLTASWNDDYSYEEKLAPLDGTSVVMNTGNHILLNPAESEFQEPGEKVDPNALPYVTYDINYQPYTSRRVHVPAGTALAGQQNIHSTDAWSFDMKVVPGQWNMTAMPVKGVVSGDMFIPAGVTDESATAPFEVTKISQESGEASDRMVNKFYCSMYNYSAVQREPLGDIEIPSSTWGYASNALATELNPGMGWSLGLNADASKTYVMRLPKNEDVYNYYRSGYWVGGVLHEDLDRHADYGTPAFTDGMTVTLENKVEAGKVFLLGNPTFAFLDLEALLAENSNLEGTFYLSGLQNTNRYNHVTGTFTQDGWLTTLQEGCTESVPARIAPMEAVLVVAKTASEKLELKLTEKMLVTSEGEREEEVDAPAPRRVVRTDVKKMHISAQASNFVSNAVLVENMSADNAALEAEDAEVFLLDENKTPFAIYTVASNKALAINQINDAEIVPLATYAQKNITSAVVTFSGEESFLSEWDLLDNKTNTRVELTNGFRTTLQMGENGAVRYYLEHARHNAPSIETGLDDTELSFGTYTHDGMLTVFSADDMYDFRLYDAAGRLITAQKNAGRQQDFSLVKGVYVVRANGNTAKVVVK